MAGVSLVSVNLRARLLIWLIAKYGKWDCLVGIAERSGFTAM
jgi:hypothetical protein